MPRVRRVVVLDHELEELRSAVGAAVVMLDLLVTHGCPDEETERQVPGAALAVLHLVGERLLHLNRTLRGELDPRLLLSSRNAMPDTRDVTRDSMVVLRPWVTALKPKKSARKSKRTSR